MKNRNSKIQTMGIVVIAIVAISAVVATSVGQESIPSEIIPEVKLSSEFNDILNKDFSISGTLKFVKETQEGLTLISSISGYRDSSYTYPYRNIIDYIGNFSIKFHVVANHIVEGKNFKFINDKKMLIASVQLKYLDEENRIISTPTTVLILVPEGKYQKYDYPFWQKGIPGEVTINLTRVSDDPQKSNYLSISDIKTIEVGKMAFY